MTAKPRNLVPLKLPILAQFSFGAYPIGRGSGYVSTPECKHLRQPDLQTLPSPDLFSAHLTHAFRNNPFYLIPTPAANRRQNIRTRRASEARETRIADRPILRSPAPRLAPQLVLPLQDTGKTTPLLTNSSIPSLRVFVPRPPTDTVISSPKLVTTSSRTYNGRPDLLPLLARNLTVKTRMTFPLLGLMAGSIVSLRAEHRRPARAAGWVRRGPQA
jgi:hypothetical protein